MVLPAKLRSRKVMGIVVLLAGIILLLWYSQQPVKGSIKPLTTQKITEPEDSASPLEQARQEILQQSAQQTSSEARKEGFSTYEGTYVSFRYPNTYTIKTQEASASGFLEKVVLLGSGYNSAKFAITVSGVGTQSLDDVSAVQMRRLNTDKYEEKPYSEGENNGIFFIKKGSAYEKTLFFLHRSLVVTLSHTATNKDDRLDDDFETLLGTMNVI